MTGKPTMKRYTCATIFVDQASDLTYIVLQMNTSAEETLRAKAELEQYAM